MKKVVKTLLTSMLLMCLVVPTALASQRAEVLAETVDKYEGSHHISHKEYTKTLSFRNGYRLASTRSYDSYERIYRLYHVIYIIELTKKY